MSALKTLTSLHLRGNFSMDWGLPPVLRPLSELRELVVVGREQCWAGRDTGAALPSLASSLQQLTHLQLTGSFACNEALKVLASLPQLQQLRWSAYPRQKVMQPTILVTSSQLPWYAMSVPGGDVAGPSSKFSKWLKAGGSTQLEHVSIEALGHYDDPEDDYQVGPLVESMSALQGLRRLDLGGNPQGDFSLLTTLTHLTEMRLGTEPSRTSSIITPSSLQVLEIEGRWDFMYKPLPPSCFSKLTKLVWSHTNLSWVTILKHLTQLENLQLNLMTQESWPGNGNLFASLTALSLLTALRMEVPADREFLVVLPETLAKLTMLQRLEMVNEQLSLRHIPADQHVALITLPCAATVASSLTQLTHLELAMPDLPGPARAIWGVKQVSCRFALRHHSPSGCLK